MKIERRKKDVIWSYFAYALTLGINVILLPVILNALSTEELGLWYTFASVSTIISLVDFGFSPTIIRNLTYAFSGARELKKEGVDAGSCTGEPNYHLFTNVFFCSRYLCLAISSLALLLLITAGSGYINYVSRDMGGKYMYAWIIYAAGCFMNLYFNYWTNSLKSIGAVAESQKAIVFAKVSQFIISALGIILGGGIFALAVAYVISGIVQRMFSKAAFMKKDNIYSNITKYKAVLTKGEIKNMFLIIWFNAKRAGVSTLMTSAMSQSGTIICSAVLGVGITGAFGLALQLISILCSVGQIYFQTNIPMLTSARIVGDKEKIKKVFSSSVMMFWFMTVLGTIALCTIGLPFLRLLGSNTVPSIWLIMGIALYNIPESNYAIHATYISMGNRLPFVNSLIVTCIVRIVLSVLLTSYTSLGVNSIIISSFISNYMYIVWKWPLEALKEIEISIFEVITRGTRVLGSDMIGMLKKTESNL